MSILSNRASTYGRGNIVLFELFVVDDNFFEGLIADVSVAIGVCFVDHLEQLLFGCLLS